MTRRLTNLLIAVVLFLFLLVVVAGIVLFVATNNGGSFLIGFFGIFTLVILYLAVTLYRGDL